MRLQIGNLDQKVENFTVQVGAVNRRLDGLEQKFDGFIGEQCTVNATMVELLSMLVGSNYDHLRRLTEAWTDVGTTTTRPAPSVPAVGDCANTAPQLGQIGGPAPYWQSFTYDVTGNRLSSTDHDPAGDSAKTVTTSHTYPAPGFPQSSSRCRSPWRGRARPYRRVCM
ncbi:hypothetical protein [Streptomyces lavendulae]|uniref:hypothetical protein n=1 Tax=Streptomyces lavendulae TaxID=1914 RepID=UPI00340CDDE4